MEDKTIKVKDKPKPDDPGTGNNQTIEDWQKQFKISDAEFAGVKAWKGWATGKKVTADELKEALKEFLGSPADKGGKNVTECK